MRTFIRNNSLTIVSFGLFLLIFFGGQTVAGHRAYNEDQVDHGEPTVGYSEYLRSAHFGEATFENWESEFLQMGAYVVLTVGLRQRGSAESKRVERGEDVDEAPEGHGRDPGAPWPVRSGGLVLKLYKHSLSIAFLLLFLLSWFMHAVTGSREYSHEQTAHGGEAVNTWQYVNRSRFWFESLQNWQSEFLAVAFIVVLTIFLREQGSPESKPVHAPHLPNDNG